jgi:hypothetical protein
MEIERLGFAYTEVAQYDLAKLDPSRRIQVRDTQNYARKEDVTRYATQMELAEFPPIVVTADAWIVDGNTRIGAALQRKQNRFPALVLDVAREGANEERVHKLHALAASLNQQNGQPLTKAEQRRDIQHVLKLGWTPAQMGRAVGLPPKEIVAARKEMDARERLEQLGMAVNGELKGPALRALGGPLALQLNDEPYRVLATLTADAGLMATEIFAAAKEIRETGSDTAAVARIEQLRAENQERIRQRALTGMGKPPVARQLRLHLAFVRKFASEPGVLVEQNAALADEHAQGIEQAVAILQAVLREQRAASGRG